MKKIQKDWLVRILACLASATILLAITIFIMGLMGLEWAMTRLVLYFSSGILFLNVILAWLRTSSYVRQGIFPPLSRGMRYYRLIATVLWWAGQAGLLTSQILCFAGVMPGNFWRSITIVAGYGLSCLGWVGIMATYHRRHTAARMRALNAGSDKNRKG